MRPLQTAVGIDISDSSLGIAVVQSRFGKLRLVNSEEIGGFPELSENAQEAAVADLAGKYGLGRARVFLTIPRRKGLSRQIELPVEVGAQMSSAVALQIESLSPWPSEEVYWGYAAENPNRNAKTISVLVGIIPRSILDPYLELFRSAGVLLSGVSLAGIAQAHALILARPNARDEARALLLDSGDGSGVYTPAMSAALLGLQDSGFKVNVMPVRDRYRHNHLRMVPTYVLIALLLLMGGALILREPYQWTVYGASLESEIELLKPAVAEVSAKEEALQKATTDYEALRSRVETYDGNLEALRELARLLPPDCWISSYSAQGRIVTLAGFAQSSSAVQKALEESPLFEDVQFSSPVVRDASGKDRFSIKAALGSTP